LGKWRGCLRIGSIRRLIKGKYQGRPRKKWLDGVQATLSRHGAKTTKNVRKARMKEMTLRDAKVECLDRVS